MGFPLSLYGRTLFRPERTTSFCSGATYAALILGMQKQRPIDPGVTDEAEESLRQTEADGSRRNDQIGLWGVWNGYGAGLYWALTDLTGAGKRVKPEEMRPGDFVQIYWSPRTGHSTIFLGWHQNMEGERFMRIWSSQEGTSGMGDWNVPVKRLYGLVCVRLTDSIRVSSAPVGTFPRTGPEASLLRKAGPQGAEAGLGGPPWFESPQRYPSPCADWDSGPQRLEGQRDRFGNWLTQGSALSQEQTSLGCHKAFDLGIFFFDTADVYANGAAETALGIALKDGPRRQEFRHREQVLLPYVRSSQ